MKLNITVDVVKKNIKTVQKNKMIPVFRTQFHFFLDRIIRICQKIGNFFFQNFEKVEYVNEIYTILNHREAQRNRGNPLQEL